MIRSAATENSRFEIASEVVILRDFVEADRFDFLEWAADGVMYTYMTFRFDSDDAAEREFERLLHHPSRAETPRRHYYLAVISLKESRPSFAGISGFDAHADGSGEFGWYLSSAHWGKGLATAATSLLLALGFERLNLPVLKATCDPENAASRRVLERCGLHLVGEVAELVKTWRGPRPRLEFRIDRGEWINRLNALPDA